MGDTEKSGDDSFCHRQEILCSFFVEVLGVDRKAAREGAEQMEQVISLDITERFVRYVRNLNKENIKQKRAGKIL